MYNLITYQKYIWSLLSVFILMSCQEEIDLDLDTSDKQKLVVESFITDENKIQHVRLTETTNYYDPDRTPPVFGATVSVDTGNGAVDFIEMNHPDSLGYYQSIVPFEGRVGKEYKLKVQYGDEKFLASSTMSPISKIDSISFGFSPIFEAGLTRDTVYLVSMYYYESPKQGDYYLLDVYVNDSLISETPQEKSFYDDESLEGNIKIPVYNLELNDEVYPGDTVRVEFKSISENTYKFYEVFINQTDLSGNPFAGAPPANMPTNMSEGAIGIFQATALRKKSRVFYP